MRHRGIVRAAVVAAVLTSVVVGGTLLASGTDIGAETAALPAPTSAALDLPAAIDPSIPTSAPVDAAPPTSPAAVTDAPAPDPQSATTIAPNPSGDPETSSALTAPSVTAGSVPLSGHILGYRLNATKLAAMQVQLYAPEADLDSSAPLYLATVTSSANYSFAAVPTGLYQLVVRYQGIAVEHRKLLSVRPPQRTVDVTLGAIDRESRDADLSGDGLPDLVARDSAGVVWVFTGNGKGLTTHRYAIATDWGSMTALVRPGDWNEDGFADLIARDAAGTMWLYPGNGQGGLQPRQELTTGWGQYISITAVSGYQFDGDVCLFPLDPDRHNVWMFCQDGEGNFSGHYSVPYEYGELYSYPLLSSVAGAGDFVGLGRPGFFHRSTWPETFGGGWEYTVYAKFEPFWYHPILYGEPWVSYVALAGAGDFDGNFRGDLVALDTSGQLWLVRSSGSVYDPNSVSVYRTLIGTGLQGFTFFR